MSSEVELNIEKIYQKEQINDFERAFQETEETIASIKLQELAARGLIRLASGLKIKISLPPEFSGRPLSEYIKEGRE
jgi:hypothetical protein